MVTCLCIGDLHFKVGNGQETGPLHEALVKIASELKPTFIVGLGDTLDRFESVNVMALTRATALLHQLTLIAPLYLLIGNHDRPNNSDFLTDRHAFNALKYWQHCKVVDTTHTEVVEGLTFTFVPYVYPGKLEEALDRASGDWRSSTAIFAHQEIYGCKLGSNRSAVGDIWPGSHPLLVSGHIHDFDMLQANVIYTGTPIQHAYGDHDDKTVSVFTFTKEGFEHRRIGLGLPRKRIIRLSCDEALSYYHEPNEQVKLVISGTEAELRSFTKSVQAKALTKANVKLQYKVKTNIPLPSERRSISYMAALYSNVKDDSNLKDLYHELFGVPRVKINLI